MKIHTQDFIALRTAITATGGLSPDATMRQRWDTLWASGFNVEALYRAGLNDDHIDTALRAIARG